MKEEKRDLERKIFPFVLRGQADEMFEKVKAKPAILLEDCKGKYNSFEEYVLKNYKTFNDLQLEYLIKSKDGKEFLKDNPKVFDFIKGETAEYCVKFTTKKPLVNACKECEKKNVCKALFVEIVK